ncbi:hypothetical protein WG66_006586 [Moniliophthora roreri]|nr:hypothetical protein WG66_006586 [Moniliophthora roreri]
MGQISLRTALLLSVYLEVSISGFLLCMFVFTMYMKFTISKIGNQGSQAQTMFVISTIMFFIATFHVVMNMFRLLLAFSDHCGKPHGPELYLGKLNNWDHVLKDALYATQEIFGSAVAIYRTWLLWNRSWLIIAFPLVVLCAEAVTGYRTLSIFAHSDPTHNIFDPHLTAWIKSFWILTVSLNVITTCLMAYFIWSTHKLSYAYQSSTSRLMPVMRILIESAVLQLVVELVLLGLYCLDSHAQYVALELVTPFVAITFNAITIRLKLLVIKEEVETLSPNSDAANVTAGNVPMQPIQISIARDVVDNDGDTQSNHECAGKETRLGEVNK